MGVLTCRDEPRHGAECSVSRPQSDLRAVQATSGPTPPRARPGGVAARRTHADRVRGRSRIRHPSRRRHDPSRHARATDDDTRPSPRAADTDSRALAIGYIFHKGIHRTEHAGVRSRARRDLPETESPVWAAGSAPVGNDESATSRALIDMVTGPSILPRSPPQKSSSVRPSSSHLAAASLSSNHAKSNTQGAPETE